MDYLEYVRIPRITKLRDDQNKAIGDAIEAIEDREKIIELSAPTSAGKTAIFAAIAHYCSEEFRMRTCISTPELSLVDQFKPDINDAAIIKGTQNYICKNILSKGKKCNECLFMKEPRDCENYKECDYHIARRGFKDSAIGLTTTAKIVSDWDLRREFWRTKGMPVVRGIDLFLMDEGDRLEPAIRQFFGEAYLPPIVIKENTIDEDMLKAEITRIRKEVIEQKLLQDISRKIRKLEEAYEHGRKAKSLEGRAMRYERILEYVMDGDDYILDINNKPSQSAKAIERIATGWKRFRPVEIHPYFSRWRAERFVVLASATIDTKKLASYYHPLKMLHPIPVDRRPFFYKPICNMNQAKRTKDSLQDMACAIIKLHETKTLGMNTLIHCHSKVIADDLSFTPAMREDERVLKRGNNENREKALKEFMTSRNKMFLSYGMERGVDLKGNVYPVNIFAKVPWGLIGDALVQKQRLKDGGEQYYHDTVNKILQGYGRTTRSPEDFSETYMLDSSFAGLIGSKYWPEWFIITDTRNIRKPSWMP